MPQTPNTQWSGRGPRSPAPAPPSPAPNSNEERPVRQETSGTGAAGAALYLLALFTCQSHVDSATQGQLLQQEVWAGPPCQRCVLGALLH